MTVTHRMLIGGKWYEGFNADGQWFVMAAYPMQPEKPVPVGPDAWTAITRILPA